MEKTPQDLLRLIPICLFYCIVFLFVIKLLQVVILSENGIIYNYESKEIVDKDNSKSTIDYGSLDLTNIITISFRERLDDFSLWAIMAGALGSYLVWHGISRSPKEIINHFSWETAFQRKYLLGYCATIGFIFSLFFGD